MYRRGRLESSMTFQDRWTLDLLRGLSACAEVMTCVTVSSITLVCTIGYGKAESQRGSRSRQGCPEPAAPQVSAAK
jgi:hypothetical protein